MQDAGKEDYLRPSERIGLDWIGLFRKYPVPVVTFFVQFGMSLDPVIKVD